MTQDIEQVNNISDNSENSDVQNKIPENRDSKGRFKPGFTGNPGGRPRNRIKDKLIEMLDENPEILESFVKELLEKHKPLVWQMLEGGFKQNIEHEGSIEVTWVK